MGIDKGSFHRNLWLHKDEFYRVSELGNTGLYITAYSYTKQVNRDNETSGPIFGNPYLDFDSENFEMVRQDVLRTLSIFRVVFKIDIDQLNIYFSGKKGIHIVIPADVFGIEPKEKLNEDFKAIANGVREWLENKTLDMRIYDDARLFRLPNTIHQDTGCYKIPLTEDELRKLSLQEIQVLARNPRRLERKRPSLNRHAQEVYSEYIERYKDRYEASTNRGERKISFTPHCIQHIWDNGAEQGKRNDSLAVLVSHFYQRGMSEEQALDSAMMWATEKCSPPMREREVFTTVRSMYRRGYGFGCRTLSQISECSNACKFYKKETVHA